MVQYPLDPLVGKQEEGWKCYAFPTSSEVAKEDMQKGEKSLQGQSQGQRRITN